MKCDEYSGSATLASTVRKEGVVAGVDLTFSQAETGYRVAVVESIRADGVVEPDAVGGRVEARDLKEIAGREINRLALVTRTVLENSVKPSSRAERTLVINRLIKDNAATWRSVDEAILFDLLWMLGLLDETNLADASIASIKEGELSERVRALHAVCRLGSGEPDLAQALVSAQPSRHILTWVNYQLGCRLMSINMREAGLAHVRAYVDLFSADPDGYLCVMHAALVDQDAVGVERLATQLAAITRTPERIADVAVALVRVERHDKAIFFLVRNAEIWDLNEKSIVYFSSRLVNKTRPDPPVEFIDRILADHPKESRLLPCRVGVLLRAGRLREEHSFTSASLAASKSSMGVLRFVS